MSVTSPKIPVGCHGNHPKKLAVLRYLAMWWNVKKLENLTGSLCLHTARYLSRPKIMNTVESSLFMENQCLLIL